MATQTLEDSLAAVEAMQKSDATKFETMARGAADGEVVDPVELQRVLLSTGKDLTAFRELVRVFTRRAELRQDMVIVREAEDRIPGLRAKIDEHNAELEKHVADHEKACRPIQAEIFDLHQTIHAKSNAKQELFDTCPSADLRLKHKEATKRAESLYRAITAENDNLQRVLADVPFQPEGKYDFRLNSIRERIAELQEKQKQAQADAQTYSDAMREY